MIIIIKNDKIEFIPEVEEEMISVAKLDSTDKRFVLNIQSKDIVLRDKRN